MTNHPLNVGIIGAGRIGKVHAENLAFRVPEARALAITGMDGRIPVVMGLAARKSYDERRPVKLSEIQ